MSAATDAGGRQAEPAPGAGAGHGEQTARAAPLTTDPDAATDRAAPPAPSRAADPDAAPGASGAARGVEPVTAAKPDRDDRSVSISEADFAAAGASPQRTSGKAVDAERGGPTTAVPVTDGRPARGARPVGAPAAAGPAAPSTGHGTAARADRRHRGAAPAAAVEAAGQSSSSNHGPARPVSARVALAAAVARLRAAGIEGAAADARRLLAHALGLEPGRLAAAISDPIDPAPFQALVARRAAHEPVSRILGHRAFYGRRFEIGPQVLDPRPETELLVDLALAEPFPDLLDLGTGSGCLAITLLVERVQARATATDLSAAALQVAGRNAAALGVAGRLVLLQGSWFAPVAGRFALIVSNPPYIARAELPGLAPEVRLWDPPAALGGGEDGLDAYREIAAGAGAHLAPGGRLLLETGWRQARQVAGLLQAAGLVQVALHRDLAGHERAISARNPG